MKRLLTVVGHETYLFPLSRLGYEIEAVDSIPGRAMRPWDERRRPIPNNLRLISLEQIRAGDQYVAAIAHDIADLMALRETESAEGKRVVMARGPLFPSVDFGYNLAYQDQESQFRFGAQKTRNRSWYFSANWNIFDRYQVYSSISRAKANRRIAEYNRRQAELDAVREIRDFINQIQEARERFDVARENVERWCGATRSSRGSTLRSRGTRGATSPACRTPPCPGTTSPSRRRRSCSIWPPTRWSSTT